MDGTLRIGRTQSRAALGGAGVASLYPTRARLRALIVLTGLVGALCVPAISVPSASASAGARNGFAPHAGSLSLSNWAGYIATGSAHEFTTASADWTVPSVTCLKNQDVYAPWVGIDGNGDRTVEQTGVETTCASGSPVSQAWYEMYPKSPVYINEPVSTGDNFSGSVSFSSATKKFTIMITNVSQSWTDTVVKKLKSAKRLSAEAVIESPDSAYPRIPAVNFTDVLLNGFALSTFSPVVSESGTPVTYAPGPITNGTNFTIASKL